MNCAVHLVDVDYQVYLVDLSNNFVSVNPLQFDMSSAGSGKPGPTRGLLEHEAISV
jgi:hypothetical protein